MDRYLFDLYRTRLYAPLFVFLLLYLFVPGFRQTFQKFAAKLEKANAIRLSFGAAIVTLIISLALIYPGKSWGGDFSQYLTQSRAIVTGSVSEWYEKNSFIIDHSFDGLGADVYPWVYSLIIAPLYLITGEINYTVLKIL